MVLGSGAVAAQKLISKLAAVAGETDAPVMAKLPEPRTYPKPAALEIINCGTAMRREIALTFDDGPTPGVTDRILDELKARGAHATFFMIGQRIAAAPDLARRVVAEGHEVANHTFTHPKLGELPSARAEEEIQKTQDVIHEILGLQPAWFRPPYGSFRPDQGPLVHNRGMRIAGGSVDPRDWSQPGEELIIGAIAGDARAGSIVICHDMHAQTANAIGAVLDGFIAAGLTPVTVSRLIAE
jgi:peptidoglycan/xylan/chitin deacetylase (PgdA/CDA1 family)